MKPLIKSLSTLLLLLILPLTGNAAAPNPYKWNAYSAIKVTITAGNVPFVFGAHSFAYNVVSPRDSASGLPTGRRQHQPITISKIINEASPLLFKALVSNETLPTVELQFLGIDNKPTGPKITLTNASVVSFAPHSQAIATDKPLADVVTPVFNQLEDVQFVFESIDISVGTKNAADDWGATVQ